jgi:hypothetical protein
MSLLSSHNEFYATVTLPGLPQIGSNETGGTCPNVGFKCVGDCAGYIPEVRAPLYTVDGTTLYNTSQSCKSFASYRFASYRFIYPCIWQ